VILPAVHPRDWTIGDLTAELKRIGAEISWCRFGQNRNEKHFPDKLGWWHVMVMPPHDTAESKAGRWSQAWAPTLELAIAKAIQGYVSWTPPDFGERVERELSSRRKISGDELLKELGL
jgi:hypothetical protein